MDKMDRVFASIFFVQIHERDFSDCFSFIILTFDRILSMKLPTFLSLAWGCTSSSPYSSSCYSVEIDLRPFK